MWPFSRKDPIEEFWDWFSSHSEELHVLDPNGSELLVTLGEKLKEIRPGLVFECGVQEGKAVELVISADGNRALFPLVLEVVKAAPRIPGWTVTAFRQPDRSVGAIEMNGRRLDAEHLRFLAEEEGGVTHLLLLVPGLTEENFDDMARMAFILLDASLGEYRVETQVGAVDLAVMPDDPDAHGCLEFSRILDHLPEITN